MPPWDIICSQNTIRYINFWNRIMIEPTNFMICFTNKNWDYGHTSHAVAISSLYSSHLDGVQGVRIAKSNPILSLQIWKWDETMRNNDTLSIAPGIKYSRNYIFWRVILVPSRCFLNTKNAEHVNECTEM